MENNGNRPEEVVEATQVEQVESTTTEGNEGGIEETTPKFESYSRKHLDDQIEIASREDELSYIDKGLDYDRIRSKYDELSGSKALKTVNELAKKYGLSAEEMAAEIEESYRAQEVEKYAQDQGFDDVDKARRFYDLEQKTKAYESEQESARAQAQKDKELAEFVDFYRDSYGKDITPDDIPQEVWEMHENGKSMVDAFIVHQFRESKKAEKIEQHNAEINEAAIGDVTKQGGATDDSVITQELLDKMSPAEMDRRWNEIQKFLKNK